MVDKVRPLKIETPVEGGTQTDMIPTEANPQQDYLAVAGVAFKDNSAYTIDLDGSNALNFKDSAETTALTLSQLILFGRQYTFGESTAETSTTSNSVFSNKVSITTPSLISGTYIVQFTYVARRSAANTEYDIRVQRGGSDIFSVTETYTRTQGSNLRSSFVQVSSISGVNTFTLDFKINSGGSGTVFLKDARLCVWRVA